LGSGSKTVSSYCCLSICMITNLVVLSNTDYELHYYTLNE